MTSDRVEFSPEALAELRELVDYIAQRNPAAAERIGAEVVGAAERLALPTPRLDGPTTVLYNGVACRRLFVHPVIVFYRRKPGALEVVRVYHHAREPISR